mgnify:CR=1 FL=1|jgi:hypothetical protein
MQAHNPNVKGRRQLESTNEIKAEFENIRGAWQLAVKQKIYFAIGQIREGLWWFCERHSRTQERRELFEQTLAPMMNLILSGVAYLRT